ncbi:hypothetical protein QYM36_013054, partial [Artemia franciscana]
MPSIGSVQIYQNQNHNIYVNGGYNSPHKQNNGWVSPQEFFSNFLSNYPSFSGLKPFLGYKPANHPTKAPIYITYAPGEPHSTVFSGYPPAKNPTTAPIFITYPSST